jgi:hypothetical protein
MGNFFFIQFRVCVAMNRMWLSISIWQRVSGTVGEYENHYIYNCIDVLGNI